MTELDEKPALVRIVVRLVLVSGSADPETSTNLTTILTSAGFSSSSVNFGNGVEFNNTGTKLFVSSFRNPNSIYEFSVSSAYDLSYERS